MHLTSDEHRALAFIAALLCLSAAVRLAALPEPVEVPGGEAFDLADHVEAVEEAVAEKEERERPLEPGETVDPNTATETELNRIPGVGPALAARIVADREANGRYRRLGDLERVAGIGARTVERLAPHVTLRPGPAGAGVGRIAGSSGGRSPGADAAPDRVDLNRAGADELAGLPGIGPVLAARIVAYRDSAGSFPDLQSLTAVKGIGQATIVRIVDRVSIK